MPVYNNPLVRCLHFIVTFAYIIFTLCTLTILVPISAVISYIIWLVAVVFSYLDPTLGRFARCQDIWMDEDFCNYIPRKSIVFSVALGGTLELNDWKSLFVNNVIQAVLPNNGDRIRYPELQQYLTRFLGFRIWKWEPNFNIDDHIYQVKTTDSKSIESIYQEMLNKPYQKKRSPWEIVLINNVYNKVTCVNETVIIMRVHHVMMDARSILMMIVECLGNKPINITKADSEISSGFLSSLKYYIMFPISSILNSAKVIYQFYRAHTHPWKIHKFRDDKYSKLYVKFSPKINFSDIQQAAKQNNVNTSSVILSIVTGALRNLGLEKITETDIPIAFLLQKPNHPDIFANHGSMGIFSLPTRETSPLKRLQQCYSILSKVNSTQLGRYVNIGVVLIGSLIGPLSRELAENHFVPMVIAINPGENEEFTINGIKCSDFRMAAGTLGGVASIFICVFSYKDTLSIGVTTKENVLSNEQTDRLAKNIAEELRLLIIKSS